MKRILLYKKKRLRWRKIEIERDRSILSRIHQLIFGQKIERFIHQAILLLNTVMNTIMDYYWPGGGGWVCPPYPPPFRGRNISGIILFRCTDRKSVSNPPSLIFQVEIYNNKQLEKHQVPCQLQVVMLMLLQNQQNKNVPLLK